MSTEKNLGVIASLYKFVKVTDQNGVDRTEQRYSHGIGKIGWFISYSHNDTPVYFLGKGWKGLLIENVEDFDMFVDKSVVITNKDSIFTFELVENDNINE